MEHSFCIKVELISAMIRLSSMGENLTQYLDDKTKEKVLDEEMKRTYRTERGSCDIIIKRITDAPTWMETKLIACKMVRKCRKEEFPARVIVVTT
jgi:hypothetical protein